ncbi:hypothetical protein GPJ56_006363 [Histomonas meleagridis]|uniref:uncharacterized protein n=1 Tax=Histomonas meleagridis TaxID=135588 RepID=UPI003559B434|nr:hypothetical protein GPJ56_006363 [Histomonas meleagridis]KAH0796820.1 hypothetical protein GO595_010713 [Histomonas meleagridis]
MEQKTFQTNIGKEYTVPSCDYFPPPIEGGSTTVFSSPNSRILNRQLQTISEITDFPPMPIITDFNSNEEYLNKLEEWKMGINEFIKKATLPVPMSHFIPRYTPPEVISAEDWSDIIVRRRLIRNYSNTKSPLSPQNFLYQDSVIQKGEEIDESGKFQFQGLDDSDVPINCHLSKNLTWGSRLVIPKPDPSLYSNFSEYESAMMNWSKYVNELDFLPPNPQQVGELIGLHEEGKPDIESPPPPREPVEPPEPLSDLPIDETSLKLQIGKLFTAYNKLIIAPDEISNIKPKKIHTATPPHCNKLISSNTLIQHMILYGVPIQEGYENLTNIMRIEHTYKDCGFLAKPDFTRRSHRYDLTKNLNEISNLLETNPSEFLLSDFSPYEFKKLLKTKIPNTHMTFGEQLQSKLTLEDIIKLSMYSTNQRFSLKFSFLVIYLITFPKIRQQIIDLEHILLERFIELFIMVGPNSFSVTNISEEEIAAATQHGSLNKQLIESLAMEFSQSSLIHALSTIVLSSKETLSKSFPFIRELIHKSYQRITTAIANESIFQSIMSDFLFSDDEIAHNFFYKLIHIVIELEYSKIIHALSGYDLLSFLQKGIDSKVSYISRHSKSIWQLFLHTSSSLALQQQLLQTSPTFILQMLSIPQTLFKDILYSIFSIFKHTNTMSEYLTFNFIQFKGFFNVFSSDLDNGSYLRFLQILLSYIQKNEEVIYCIDKEEFKNFINSYGETISLQFKDHASLSNSKCLSTLYKTNLLNEESIHISELWGFILNEMGSKNDMADNYRQSLWNIFKNAMFYSRNIMNNILIDQELTKKLDSAFSSLDMAIIACMIRTLNAFGKVLLNQNALGEVPKQNLQLLFEHLSQPTVLVAGKLVSAYKWSKEQPEMRQLFPVTLDFFATMLESKPDTILYSFMNADPIINNIGEVLSEVVKLMKFRKNNE